MFGMTNKEIKRRFGLTVKKVSFRQLTKKERERLSIVEREVALFIKKIHDAHKTAGNSKLLFKQCEA